eukprot:403335363
MSGSQEAYVTTLEIYILIGIYFSSIFGFLAIYTSIQRSLELNGQKDPRELSNYMKEYVTWTPQQKADFISRITSQMHAFLSICLAIKALFYTCVEPGHESEGYTNFFQSDYCLMKQTSVWQLLTLCFTAGYLTFDTYICYTKIQEHSKMQTQTYIHHATGITGFICAIIYGPGGALIISNVLLINELSTFFLNYRQFFLVFKKTSSPWYKYNAVAFLFTFLFARIVFNTIVALWIWKALYLTIKNNGNGMFDIPLWKLTVGLYLIGLFVEKSIIKQ